MTMTQASGHGCGQCCALHPSLPIGLVCDCVRSFWGWGGSVGWGLGREPWGLCWRGGQVSTLLGRQVLLDVVVVAGCGCCGWVWQTWLGVTLWMKILNKTPPLTPDTRRSVHACSSPKCPRTALRTMPCSSRWVQSRCGSVSSGRRAGQAGQAGTSTSLVLRLHTGALCSMCAHYWPPPSRPPCITHPLAYVP